MDNRILICNKDKSITAEVFPDYGGMVSRLCVNGRDILYLDEGRLSDAPMTAGGIPVLFPFAGKTKNDSYVFEGKKYYMPKHGLVKDRSFSIKEQCEDTVTLCLKADEVLLEQNYPFSFEITISYKVSTDSLIITAYIENNAQVPMPHAIGWHPYFKATDRNRIKLIHHMKLQYDYIQEKDSPAPEQVELNKMLDDVFYEPQLGEYILNNKADGYEARCMMDKEYKTMVVYTGREGCVCVEPWCALPDSIHNGRLLEWIPAGEGKNYTFKIQLKALQEE